MIGYRVESRCAIVFGDPVCSRSDKERLALAFQHYCREQGWEIVYVTASKEFADWAIQNICGALIEFGEELIFDPFNDPKQGSKGRLLRGKVNQALRNGTEVREYISHDPILEKAIEQVGVTWLKARKGPQIYLAHVHLFAERIGKRWFYAVKGGHIVGVLLMNQLEAKKGWLMQLLMTTPEACNGTSELLVTAVIETLRKEGCRFLAFGATASEFGEIIGLSKPSTWLARGAFKIAKKIFSLDGRRKYWQKFNPQSERSFVLFGQSRITMRAVIGMMRALNVPL
jgi:lysylphosphatidylglycerol synthetase-like protein (DUF2156 family)